MAQDAHECNSLYDLFIIVESRNTRIRISGLIGEVGVNGIFAKGEPKVECYGASSTKQELGRKVSSRRT